MRGFIYFNILNETLSNPSMVVGLLRVFLWFLLLFFFLFFSPFFSFVSLSLSLSLSFLDLCKWFGLSIIQPLRLRMDVLLAILGRELIPKNSLLIINYYLSKIFYFGITLSTSGFNVLRLILSKFSYLIGAYYMLFLKLLLVPWLYIKLHVVFLKATYSFCTY